MMRKRFLGLALLGVLPFFILFVSFGVEGKPTAPVAIESAVPDNLRAGDTVSTAIRFTAQADAEQMEVSVAPYEGLEVLQSPEKVVFYGVRKGEIREIAVTVRLTADVGYLSVFAALKTARETSTRAVAIRYGMAKAADSQSKAEASEKGQTGERLILIPAEARP